MGASDLTLLSSRPISSAKRLIWASRPSSLGSEVTGKEEETHTPMLGRDRLGRGLPGPHPMPPAGPPPALTRRHAPLSLCGHELVAGAAGGTGASIPGLHHARAGLAVVLAVVRVGETHTVREAEGS